MLKISPLKDIFKNKVELGESPRMIFGGEESGGMIIGSNDIIKIIKMAEQLLLCAKKAQQRL